MKRMTKVWGMLCLAGLLISLYLGVSFLVPKQGKIILTFGMFSVNQSDKQYAGGAVQYTRGI